jgi:hypothetical protein
MSNAFGFTTATDEVLAGIDLHGKRVLVTGVSAGLGVETARALAAQSTVLSGPGPSGCPRPDLHRQEHHT